MINLNKVDVEGYIIKVDNKYFKEKELFTKDINKATSCIDEDTCKDIAEILNINKYEIKKVLYKVTNEGYECILLN